jgi:hypothetical protein
MNLLSTCLIASEDGHESNMQKLAHNVSANFANVTAKRFPLLVTKTHAQAVVNVVTHAVFAMSVSLVT